MGTDARDSTQANAGGTPSHAEDKAADRRTEPLTTGDAGDAREPSSSLHREGGEEEGGPPPWGEERGGSRSPVTSVTGVTAAAARLS